MKDVKVLLRNIASDLVEKRLWPVALAMVLALVAAPLLLVRSAPEATAEQTAQAPATAGLSGSSAVTGVAQDVVVRRNRPGRLRDVFDAPATATASDPGTTTSSSGTTPPPVPSGSTGTSSPSARPSSPAPSSSGGPIPVSPGPSPSAIPSTGSAPSTTPLPDVAKEAPANAAAAPGTINVRLWRGKGEARTIRGLRPLSPLPSASDPFLVFLRIDEDAKGGPRAVFMLSSDATRWGDGRCKPDGGVCETIELRQGDMEFIDVRKDGGEVVEYRLDLTRITRAR
jgi:hypothetical protein